MCLESRGVLQVPLFTTRTHTYPPAYYPAHPLANPSTNTFCFCIIAQAHPRAAIRRPRGKGKGTNSLARTTGHRVTAQKHRPTRPEVPSREPPRRTRPPGTTPTAAAGPVAGPAGAPSDHRRVVSRRVKRFGRGWAALLQRRIVKVRIPSESAVPRPRPGRALRPRPGGAAQHHAVRPAQGVSQTWGAKARARHGLDSR